MIRVKWLSSLVCSLILLSLLLPSVGAEEEKTDEPAQNPGSNAEKVDFVTQIQPIFKAKCYSCHADEEEYGGLRLDVKLRAMDGGDSGPVIVPGESEKSKLVHLLIGTEEGERMPPEDAGTALDEEQIKLVSTWIDQGADWPAAADLAGTKQSDHWAFQPIVKPEIPQVNGQDWVRTPIDAFILAKLEAEGVKPSPEADKETLLRRLCLDLTGLPPSPEEVEAFLEDDSPQAYEKQVDRLLASKHYGERWARHWLDVARYADSDGYEKDLPRPHAWRWRDWVINALNKDLPFDEFTRQQIAGDLLPGASTEQKVATGFHRNTLINREGGIDKEEDRVKRTVDRTNTVGSVWLGLTVGCAQCHNHKYDPITQRDYFSLYAFFNSLDEPDIPAATQEAVKKYQEEKAKYDQQHAPFLAAIKEYEKTKLAEAQAAWEAAGPSDELNWNTFVPENLKSEKGSTLKALEDGVVVASGENPDSDVYTVTSKISTPGVTAIRLETLPDESLEYNGPGRSYRGNYVLSGFKVEVAPADKPEAFKPVKISRVQADFSQKDWPIEAAINGDPKTGWAIAPEFGKPHYALFELAEDIGSDAGVIVKVTLDQTYESEAHNIGRFRLTTSKAPRPVKMDSMPQGVKAILALKPEERSDANKAELAKYYRTIDPGLAKLQRAAEADAKKAPADPSTQIKAQAIAQMKSPRDTRILIRGDFLNPGSEVEINTPGVLPELETEGETPTRIDLANWLVSPENPLTTRVTVNRIWTRYFGRGLVHTVEDFGTQGDEPSHPGLLDYLAVTFREQDWSMKALHRLIVTSAVYRQSSAARPELLERDPYNAWLASQNRLRVEAEVVRDLALSACGLMVDKVGGPSVRPPQPEGLASLGYANQVKWQTSQGEDRYRRGLYTFFQRTVPYPMLTTFDAPDSNVTCTRRERSNTPLQSLTLWNDPVFFECAQQLGRRIITEAEVPEGKTDAQSVRDARLNYAVQLCLSRSASEQEMTALRDAYQTQLQLCQENSAALDVLVGKSPVPPETNLPELSAYILVGRTLMNLDEFVTKE